MSEEAGGTGPAQRDDDYYTNSCLPYAQFYLQRFRDNEEGLLQLSLCDRHVDDACVESLIDAMRGNTHVMQIVLNRNRITDAGAACIAESLERPGCKIYNVELSGNNITEVGAQRLVDALQKNGTVTSLDLSECPGVPQAVHDLADAACERNRQPVQLKAALLDIQLHRFVQRIDLSAPPKPTSPFRSAWGGGPPVFDLRSVQLLADAIRGLPTLVALDLSHNCRGDEATRIVAGGVGPHPSLQELLLRGNAITDTGARLLAEALQENTSLFELDLSDNVIGNKGASCFTELVQVNATLCYIVLDKNNVSPETRSQVAHSLLLNSQPQKLKDLYSGLCNNSAHIASVVLDGQQEDGRGGGADAAAPAGGGASGAAHAHRASDAASQPAQGAAKKQLNDISCRVLSNALRANTTVRRLILTNNRIRDEGAQTLAHLLSENGTLEKLDLRGNLITAKGARCLAGALSGNASVKHLLLGGQLPEPIPADTLQQVETQLLLNLQPLALKRLVPLLQADDPSVTVVDLTSFDRSQVPSMAACDLVAASLEGNTHVTELVLSHNTGMSRDGLQRILSVLGRDTPRIKTLRLAHMGLGDEHAQMISDIIASETHLTELDLSGNAFTQIGGWVQGLLERNHTLTSIGLQGSVAGANPSDLQELEVVLRINAQPRKLKHIVLRAYNNDPTLQDIDLTEFTPGGFGGSYAFSKKYNDGSAKLLCDALLRNQHVKKLNVSSNRIGDAGACAIADMLMSNRSIHTINVSNNVITDDGFKAIGTALLTNPSLSCLIVDGNPIRDPATRKQLNLVTGHNTAAVDAYSINATIDGTRLLDRELEEAIAADAMQGYTEAASLGGHGGSAAMLGASKLRTVMAKYNRPLYTG